MPNSCTYCTISEIYNYGNISSNTVTSGMVQECIDRAGFKVNKDLGADHDGSDYYEFQASNSGGSSYVPTNALALIVKAHANICNAYTMVYENAPDMDLYTEVDGKLVNYRSDIRNEAKIRYYLNAYNRAIEFLMDTDNPDNYFGRHVNRNRGVFLCEPTYDIEPRGNPL